MPYKLPALKLFSTVFFVLGIVFMLFSAYFMSFDLKKRLWWVLTLPILILFLVFEDTGHGFYAMFGILAFIVASLARYLVTRYNQGLRKGRHAFTGFIITAVPLIFIQAAGYQANRVVKLTNLVGSFSDGIAAFFLLMSHIVLAVLIIANIVLNKKKAPDSVKVRWVYIYLPLIMVGVVVVWFSIHYFLFG